jgi:hypothetical protein
MADQKVTVKEFLEKFIPLKRKADKSKGVHAVFSGLNTTLAEYYGLPQAKEDRRAAVIALIEDAVERKECETRPCTGGVMVYLPGDAPAYGAKTDETLKAMGLIKGK